MAIMALFENRLNHIRIFLVIGNLLGHFVFVLGCALFSLCLNSDVYITLDMLLAGRSSKNHPLKFSTTKQRAFGRWLVLTVRACRLQPNHSNVQYGAHFYILVLVNY